MAKGKALTLAQLQALAAEAENQTETTTGGGFEYELPEAGLTVGRLIEYIELGMQKQPAYKGKAKPDNQDVRITFELLAPKNKHEYQDADGNDRVRYDKISFKVSKKLNEKAKYYKLFTAMRYGRDDITHMAQMLGNPFRLRVYHNENEKNGVTKTYANLWDGDGSMEIGAPIVEDALTGKTTKIPVPEAVSPFKIFLWSNPTQETWDSLFIDGEYEATDDKPARSKNWIQETILGATDYSGSRLEALVGGLTEEETPLDEEANEGEEVEVEETEQEAEEAEPAPRVAKAAAKPAGKPVVPAKAAPAKPVAKPAAKPAQPAPKPGKPGAKPVTKQAKDSDAQLRAMGLI